MVDSRKIRDIKEPIIPINGTGYGIKIKDLITIMTIVFIGGGAYFMVRNQIENLSSLAKSNQTIAVQLTETTRSIITKEVMETRILLKETVEDIFSKIEASRKERIEDIKELNLRVNQGDQERARMSAQIESLAELMREIRDAINDNKKPIDRSTGE